MKNYCSQDLNKKFGSNKVAKGLLLYSIDFT